MKKRLDKMLIVDIESTCWEGRPAPGQENEVIEIGACLLDVASGERSDKEGILVRPTRSTVSPFCTGLTTLTQEQVAGGVPFREACGALRDRFGADKRVWASYGDYDRRQFERQCAREDIAYPFGPTHLNVKTLAALALGLSAEVGLDRALELLELPLEGTHHRGIDDAWNIASVLSLLLKRVRTRSSRGSGAGAPGGRPAHSP